LWRKASKGFFEVQSKRYKVIAPALAPICAKGPSFPTVKPPAMAKTTPNIFVINVGIEMVYG
jgi:hypothetical protein